MASDSIENNYHNAGSSQGKGKFGVDDIDSTPAGTEQSAVSDEKLRMGLFRPETDQSARPIASSIDVGFSSPQARFADRLDQTQLANVMQEFPTVTFVDFGGEEISLAGKDTKSHGDNSKVADSHYEDDDDDEGGDSYGYGGAKETQEAVARLATQVSRDSQIPERLWQTLDRLNRQAPESESA